MRKVGEMLCVAGTVGTVFAEKQGGKVLKNGKSVLLNLDSSNSSVYKKLRNFCPNAKKPKILFEGNISEIVNNIRMQFYDGETALSRVFLEYQQNGKTAFDVLITDADGVKQIAAKGTYNPNKKFFTKKNYGVGYEERNGYKKGHLDSDGFDVNIAIKNGNIAKIVDDAKKIFSKFFV